MSQEAVERYFEALWSVFEPIMFCLIGADIDTAVLDGDMVGLAVGCIFISLAVRVPPKLAGWRVLERSLSSLLKKNSLKKKTRECPCAETRAGLRMRARVLFKSIFFNKMH